MLQRALDQLKTASNGLLDETLQEAVTVTFDNITHFTSRWNRLLHLPNPALNIHFLHFNTPVVTFSPRQVSLRTALVTCWPRPTTWKTSRWIFLFRTCCWPTRSCYQVLKKTWPLILHSNCMIRFQKGFLSKTNNTIYNHCIQTCSDINSILCVYLLQSVRWLWKQSAGRLHARSSPPAQTQSLLHGQILSHCIDGNKQHITASCDIWEHQY